MLWISIDGIDANLDIIDLWDEKFKSYHYYGQYFVTYPWEKSSITHGAVDNFNRECIIKIPKRSRKEVKITLNLSQ